jgi:hypothetical protein
MATKNTDNRSHLTFMNNINKAMETDDLDALRKLSKLRRFREILVDSIFKLIRDNDKKGTFPEEVFHFMFLRYLSKYSPGSLDSEYAEREAHPLCHASRIYIAMCQSPFWDRYFEEFFTLREYSSFPIHRVECIHAACAVTAYAQNEICFQSLIQTLRDHIGNILKLVKIHENSRGHDFARFYVQGLLLNKNLDRERCTVRIKYIFRTFNMEQKRSYFSYMVEQQFHALDTVILPLLQITEVPGPFFASGPNVSRRVYFSRLGGEDGTKLLDYMFPKDDFKPSLLPADILGDNQHSAVAAMRFRHARNLELLGNNGERIRRFMVIYHPDSEDYRSFFKLLGREESIAAVLQFGIEPGRSDDGQANIRANVPFLHELHKLGVLDDIIRPDFVKVLLSHKKAELEDYSSYFAYPELRRQLTVPQRELIWERTVGPCFELGYTLAQWAVYGVDICFVPGLADHVIEYCAQKEAMPRYITNHSVVPFLAMHYYRVFKKVFTAREYSKSGRKIVAGVVPLQPKKSRKRRSTIATNENSSHPLKKKREEEEDPVGVVESLLLQLN